ncbi:MAG: CarD family transcriptional regulator, partial [Eggerthellaceae bacterium]
MSWRGQRATYVSIMRVGGHVDDELPVKRVEVAGHPDKLFGRLRSLVDTDYRWCSVRQFPCAPGHEAGVRRPRSPIQTLDAEEDATNWKVAKRRLRRGVVNVVDVDIPLGMIIPKAKLALVSVSDTQGASAARPSRHIDVTDITFPYKPGDYVVHAAHGVAHFKELVRRDVDGTARDYLLLEYAEGDKL